MLFMPCTASCRELFKQLNILTVPSLYIFNSVTFIKLNPENFIQERNGCSRYGLRSNYNIGISQHKLSLVANGPTVMGIKLFNKLPANNKNLDNLNEFKTAVKNLLIRSSFYSVTEYLDADFNN